MKAFKFCLPLLLACGVCHAQQISYSSSIDVGFEHPSFHIIESKVAGQPTRTSLSFCFGKSVRTWGVLTAGEFDHVSMPLAVADGRVTGASITQDRKLPVRVSLIRETSGTKVKYNGVVTVSGTDYKVSGEFAEGEDWPRPEYGAPTINEKPESFREFAPSVLALRVKNDSIGQVMEVLRKANTSIDILGDNASDPCARLRSGYFGFRVYVAPEKSEALRAALLKLPYVVQVGWSTPSYYTGYVRVAGQGWLTNGVFNRPKISAALVPMVEKMTGGKSISSTWNMKTGELVVKVRRPTKLFPRTGLTDEMIVPIFVGQEKLGGGDSVILWLGEIRGDVVDVGAGPRVGVGILHLVAAPPEGFYDTLEAAEVAKALKAQHWDNERNLWRRE